MVRQRQEGEARRYSGKSGPAGETASGLSKATYSSAGKVPLSNNSVVRPSTLQGGLAMREHQTG